MGRSFGRLRWREGYGPSPAPLRLAPHGPCPTWARQSRAGDESNDSMYCGASGRWVVGGWIREGERARFRERHTRGVRPGRDSARPQPRAGSATRTKVRPMAIALGGTSAREAPGVRACVRSSPTPDLRRRATMHRRAGTVRLPAAHDGGCGRILRRRRGARRGCAGAARRVVGQRFERVARAAA